MSWLLLIGLAMVLASCRGPNVPQQAPPLGLEGIRLITDDAYLYAYPLWSPDGGFVAAARNIDNQLKVGPDLQGWEVVLIDLQTMEISILHGPDWQSIPSWSPTGDELAYVASTTQGSDDGETKRTHLLAIYSLVERAERLFPCETCSNPTWLADGSVRVDVSVRQEPDGPWLAANTTLDPRNGTLGEAVPYVGMPSLQVGLADGGSARMHGPYAVMPLDGSMLMTAYDHGCRGIWVYRPDANGPSFPFIDSADVDECDPAVSSDGTRLLYTIKAPRQLAATTIMLANADGTSPVTLLEPGGDPYQARYPTWSPDGTQFAFAYGLFQETGPSYSTLYVADVPAALQPGGRD